MEEKAAIFHPKLNAIFEERKLVKHLVNKNGIQLDKPKKTTFICP